MSISKRILLYQALILSLCGVFYLYLNVKPHNGLYFLDVGQGDSMYLYDNGVEVVIDGGPDRSSLDKLNRYRPHLDNRIDAVVITHMHADHIMGIIYLLEEYKVGTLYVNDSEYKTVFTDELYDRIKEHSVDVQSLTKGQQIRIPSGHIDVYWPEKGFRYVDPNDESIVLRIVTKNCHILLTGDVEFDFIHKPFFDWVDATEVIKVPHHGSAGGLSFDLVERNPNAYYIISVGKGNMYRHPDPETLEFLRGHKVYRTDQDGDVVVQFTNEVCTAETVSN